MEPEDEVQPADPRTVQLLQDIEDADAAWYDERLAAAIKDAAVDPAVQAFWGSLA